MKSHIDEVEEEQRPNVIQILGRFADNSGIHRPEGRYISAKRSPRERVLNCLKVQDVDQRRRLVGCFSQSKTKWPREVVQVEPWSEVPVDQRQRQQHVTKVALDRLQSLREPAAP